MDSCKIQVTKGRAKGSIELIEGSPTEIPRLAETCRSSRILCFIYPSFAFSDFQRPCFLNSLSFTPILAAEVAPPERKLGKPNLFRGSLIFSKASSTIFLAGSMRAAFLCFLEYTHSSFSCSKKL